MDSIKQISLRLREIEDEITQLSNKLDNLETEAEELKEAQSILKKHFGKKSDGSQAEVTEIAYIPITGLSLARRTKQQKTLLHAIPSDYDNAKKPVEIIKSCPSLDPSYVRSTLWRLANTGVIHSEEGYYWKE